MQFITSDDESARRKAQAHGIDFTGTLGVLAVARRRKLIPALKPYLERVFEQGFYISPELVRSLLEDIGEA